MKPDFVGRVRRRLRRAAGRAAPHGHHHQHRQFSESELLARADEWNRNAESHWQSIRTDRAGREHALGKPMSTVQDTGPMLYRLGLLITELRLGVGHTVLDFAAGSCWLSSLLNRLRCRTISIDVSPTALELGKELFALDPRQRPELEPRFLPYDGHQIPLAAGSVDRIAVFDAFHHVPNQDEVLREMARVLRPGGRVVMAEPGENHSHADQSHMEMERFGVLENDIHFDELAHKARAAGFSAVLVKPYAAPEAMTFTEQQFLSFMKGRDSVFPVRAIRASLHDFLLIILLKGEEQKDSRAPGLLRAAFELKGPPAPLLAEPGETLRLEVAVRNDGDTLWLHEVDAIGGYVGAGVHVLSAGGEMVVHSAARQALPKDVAPGETVSFTVAVPLPAARGDYVLRIDLVDEFVVWFEMAGSAVLDVPCKVAGVVDSRRPNRLQAAIRVAAHTDTPDRIGLQLRIRNDGDTSWLAATADGVGSVRLGAQLRDGERVAERDYFRASLPRNVDPGDEVALVVSIPRPPSGTNLELDMVDEGIRWFAEGGSATVAVALTS